jgi:putative toxin-antitoxin system antitoxin component (TIGR02293 family)
VEITLSGLPIRWLEQLALLFGVSVTAFAGVDSRTLSRRRKEGRLTHRESNALYHLAVLYEHALAVLGDTESVPHWFNTEEDDFSGMKPIELLDTASGIKEVDQLLGRIEHGVF